MDAYEVKRGGQFVVRREEFIQERSQGKRKIVRKLITIVFFKSPNNCLFSFRVDSHFRLERHIHIPFIFKSNAVKSSLRKETPLSPIVMNEI